MLRHCRGRELAQVSATVGERRKPLMVGAWLVTDESDPYHLQRDIHPSIDCYSNFKCQIFHLYKPWRISLLGDL